MTNCSVDVGPLLSLCLHVYMYNVVHCLDDSQMRSSLLDNIYIYSIPIMKEIHSSKVLYLVLYIIATEAISSREREQCLSAEWIRFLAGQVRVKRYSS